MVRRRKNSAKASPKSTSEKGALTFTKSAPTERNLLLERISNVKRELAEVDATDHSKIAELRRIVAGIASRYRALRPQQQDEGRRRTRGALALARLRDPELLGEADRPEWAQRSYPAEATTSTEVRDELRRINRRLDALSAPSGARKEAPLRSTDAVKKTVELSEREKKIWEVIQRGSKGATYCRELHAAGITPRKKGVWVGAPPNYIAAYKESAVWRHRIQDEKSKIRRKAELAKLAKTRKSLAGE